MGSSRIAQEKLMDADTVERDDIIMISALQTIATVHASVP
jgi:hypothetical protein